MAKGTSLVVAALLTGGGIYTLGALGCGGTGNATIPVADAAADGASAARPDRTSPPELSDGGGLDPDPDPLDGGADADAARDASSPSCNGVPSTCGASAADDCCRAATVPGGTFKRVNDVDAPATVSTFALDVYAVTVARFRAFVASGAGTKASPPAAGAGAHPKVAGSGWKAEYNASLPATTDALVAAVGCAGGTYTVAPGANERRPVQCVNWYEAFAFCAWDGGRLPTEAELSYAEVGGAEQRIYPWSSPPASSMIDESRAVYMTTASAEVGSRSPLGDGRWGHTDLSGNVWAWGADGYVDPFPATPCNDCILGGASPQFRIRRGGAFNSPEKELRAFWRKANGPPNHMVDGGVRCARSPSP